MLPVTSCFRGGKKSNGIFFFSTWWSAHGFWSGLSPWMLSLWSPATFVPSLPGARVSTFCSSYFRPKFHLQPCPKPQQQVWWVEHVCSVSACTPMGVDFGKEINNWPTSVSATSLWLTCFHAMTVCGFSPDVKSKLVIQFVILGYCTAIKMYRAYELHAPDVSFGTWCCSPLKWSQDFVYKWNFAINTVVFSLGGTMMCSWRPSPSLKVRSQRFILVLVWMMIYISAEASRKSRGLKGEQNWLPAGKSHCLA